MSQNFVINGVTYPFPDVDDLEWGQQVTDWANAVTAGMLQKAGGSFTLTAETDFGGSFGLKSLYYKSRTSNPASAGQIRLARADVISWRNQANGADVTLGVDSSDRLVYGSSVIALLDGTQTFTGAKSFTAQTIIGGGTRLSTFDTSGRLVIRYDDNGQPDGLTLQNRGIDNSSQGIKILFQLDTGGASGVNSAYIYCRADDNYSASANQDAELRFAVALNGSNTERMVLNKNGYLGVGILTPQGPLQVKQASDINLLVAGATSLTGAISLNAVNDANGANIPMEFRASKFNFSTGNVGVGADPGATLHVLSNTADVDSGLRIERTSSTTGRYNLFVNSSGHFVVGEVDGGTKRLIMDKTTGYITAPGIYDQTDAGAANVVVNSSGKVMRSTSSRRYKEAISDVDALTLDLLKFLRPVTYAAKKDPDGRRYVGLIAEEVDEAGLSDIVEYDDQGRPDSVHYDRLAVLLLGEVNRLREKVGK